jgi:hypothetical protein
MSQAPIGMSIDEFDQLKASLARGGGYGDYYGGGIGGLGGYGGLGDYYGGGGYGGGYDDYYGGYGGGDFYNDYYGGGYGGEYDYPERGQEGTPVEDDGR